MGIKDNEEFSETVIVEEKQPENVPSIGSIEIEIDTEVEEEQVIKEKEPIYIPNPFCPERKTRLSSFIRLVVLITLVITIAVLLILSVIPNSPVQKNLLKFLVWVQNVDTIIQVICILLLYVISTPLGTPISPINLACGYLFHIWGGLAVAITGSMLGSIICYLAGTTLLYGYAVKKMDTHRMLKALSLAAKSKKSILIISLTHFSPLLPATLLHYTFAAVGVHILPFVTGTFIGVLPFVILYVIIGSSGRSLETAISASGDSWKKDLIWIPVIIIGSIIIFIVVTWIGRRELKKVLEEMDKKMDAEAQVTTGIELVEIPVTFETPQISKDLESQLDPSEFPDNDINEGHSYQKDEYYSPQPPPPQHETYYDEPEVREVDIPVDEHEIHFTPPPATQINFSDPAPIEATETEFVDVSLDGQETEKNKFIFDNSFNEQSEISTVDNASYADDSEVQAVGIYDKTSSD